MKRKPITPRRCAHCDRVMMKPNNYSWAQFEKRKFCGVPCHVAFVKKPKDEER